MPGPAIESPPVGGDPTMPAPAPTRRLDFIDALRGLVICLMVLDHVRDLTHRDALLFDPTDLSRTTAALFFTRWITHLCAPTFVLLAGVSIFLQARKGKAGWPLSRFLLARGLWLVALEVTLVNFGFDLSFGVFLQVIYAIGIGMVFMAAMVHLPRAWVLALGLLIVFGHDALDAVRMDGTDVSASLWHLLVQPGPLPFGMVTYPALPWFGIMCVGYGIGGIYLAEPDRRTRVLAIMGVAMLVLFFILRVPNIYGDPVPWTKPAHSGWTTLAVLNVTKYPPSLAYVLLTLGITTLGGLALERAPAWLLRPLLAFGRTPMLTYLLHLYVARLLVLAIGAAWGIPASDFLDSLGDPSRLIRDGWGLPLWGTYAVWISVLVILYPIARAYARFKATQRRWWTSYI
ncbi:DUF1624 domain-containing protein [Bacillus sp. NP157]|nr:DUF1624 domain-containing protein [Bacillus sp. NP157]